MGEKAAVTDPVKFLVSESCLCTSSAIQYMSCCIQKQ